MMECLADIMAPWVHLDDSDHDAHWHRYNREERNLSMWADNKDWNHTDDDEWWVEVYPDPETDHDHETRRKFDSKEEAAQFAADFMENHS